MRLEAAAVAAALALMAAASSAQEVAFEGAAGVATGDYIFPQNTTSGWLSAGLALRAGPVTFRGSIPLWFQNSTVISGLEIGPTATGGSSGGTVADSGAARKGRGMGSGSQRGSVAVPASSFTDFRTAVGDPLVGASVLALAGRRTSLSLGTSVKIPVADTANFGTGAWDLGFTGYLTQSVATHWSLGLSAGYWTLGDMPDLKFDDVFQVGLVGSYLTLDGWAFSVTGSGGNAAVGGYDPPITVGASVTRVASSGSWGAALELGLSESAPDVMLGFTWALGL